MNNQSLKKSQRNSTKFRVFVWSLFDLANTSYSIIIVTFVYAVYFKNVVASGEQIGDFYWGLGVGISMILAALLSPILGAIADYNFGKKRFLLVFSVLCIISTSLLYFVGPGDIILGLILFILANLGFEAGLVFYDAFLPEITEPHNYGRVSGYGYAAGYIGSLLSLAIVFPFIQAEMINYSFPVSAVFFLIFAIPIFLFLKENRKKEEQIKSFSEFVNIGYSRVKFTITHLKNYKNLGLFLISFFVYIEGVNTVIFFSGNYASSTLNFSMEQLTLFFIIVQSTAILGAALFGIIADSIGFKKTIIITLIIWTVIVIFAYFSSSENTYLIKLFQGIFGLNVSEAMIYSFYLVGLFAGSVLGATQSVSRSLMSKLTPEDKKTEFFGFYSLFGKSSAVLGPFLFGTISYLLESQRIAIISLGVFFIVGMLLLRKVEEPKISES